MLCLTCTMLSSVDLARYGVPRAIRYLRIVVKRNKNFFNLHHKNYGEPFYDHHIPVGIWCENYVVSTSMRPNHVASTLILRHFYIMCPLGWHLTPNAVTIKQVLKNKILW